MLRNHTLDFNKLHCHSFKSAIESYSDFVVLLVKKFQFLELTKIQNVFKDAFSSRQDHVEVSRICQFELNVMLICRDIFGGLIKHHLSIVDQTCDISEETLIFLFGGGKSFLEFWEVDRMEFV